MGIERMSRALEGQDERPDDREYAGPSCAEGATNEDEEAAGDVATGQPLTLPDAGKQKIKSQAYRNRERKRKDLDATQAQRKQQRELEKSVDDIDKILKEIMQKEEWQEERKQYRKQWRLKRLERKTDSDDGVSHTVPIDTEEWHEERKQYRKQWRWKRPQLKTADGGECGATTNPLSTLKRGFPPPPPGVRGLGRGLHRGRRGGELGGGSASLRPSPGVRGLGRGLHRGRLGGSP